jgi:IMP dehydrogenase
MDSVIGKELALAMLQAKGLPILHGFYGETPQLYALVDELKERFPHRDDRLGLLLSPDLTQLSEIAPLLQDRISVIALDTLHQSPHLHLQAVRELKHRFPHLEIISGNVVFSEDCRGLIQAGVDAIRVGMTSASINRGRELLGCGRRQASAVWDCAKVTTELGVPLIADGGVKTISDAVIAFALGADAVMMGQRFASLPESAAPMQTNAVGDRVKIYRGMSRKGKIAADLIPEGTTKELPVASDFDTTVLEWVAILKLAISRAGFSALTEFKTSALLEFIL